MSSIHAKSPGTLIDRVDLLSSAAGGIAMSSTSTRHPMTGRKMAKALAVAAMTFIGVASQADGLTLVNQTGWPVYYSVEDVRGQPVPGGAGCLDLIRSINLSGPAHATRQQVVVRGQTRNGGRGSNCHGSTASNTGNGLSLRVPSGGPKTMTFTLESSRLVVR